MIQQQANKYKFYNVLVADTRLLVPMDSSRGSRQPDVLVLNSKLYKCQAHQINCASCCLHIEQPEFRRRSSSSDSDTDCFADCSKRRSIDVEITAKVQLNGKLVILALSRFEYLIDESLSAGSQFRCQTKSTWPFLRFDPSNMDSKLAYYSRFSSNQVPSLLVESMNFSWNHTNNRELISLAIKSNLNNRIPITRRRLQQQIVMNETLLISEMDCFKYQFSGSENPSTLGGPPHSGLLTPSKVHLLILINRQSGTISNERVSDNYNNGISTPTSIVQTRVHNQVEPRKSVDLGPESYIDYPSGTTAAATPHTGRMASSIGPLQQTKARSISPSSFFHSNYKLASATSTTTTSTTTRRPQTTSTDGNSNLLKMNVPFLHKKYEFKINESPRMGSAYLNENDLIRARLRSSSFLVLTISSGLVILTYTLCLLAYLRWRHRIRARSRDTASADVATSNKTDDDVVPIRRVELDISQPYNLQMPPATRTRLKMMLRGGINLSGTLKPEARLPVIGVRSEDNSTLVAELRLAERRRKSRLLMSSVNRRDEVDANYAPPNRGKTVSQVNERGGQYSTRYKSQRQLNFGSINVVRAIRQAATLARSRLNLHSRYRPNLNVILESDLECLQSPARCDTYQGLFNQNNLIYISPPKSSRPEAQFDTLVQDAMRTDCSHYVDRLTSQRQANATLFSRPFDEATNPSDAVSRSKILRQVKQEDMFENLDTERAEI